jgi:hypothetical protein
MEKMTTPLTVSLGNPTTQYEYRGKVKLPENDTLAWLAEEIGDVHESRCRVSSTD